MRQWVLIAAACGGFQANPSRHYHLEIASDFSADETTAIFDAATEWQRESHGYVTFDGAPAATDIITFRIATPSQLATEFGGGYIGVNVYQGQSANIQILSTLDAQTFHQTALHEIGHAIGLAHTTPGNVMCANTTCATLVVACGDLHQLTGGDIAGCTP